MKKIACKDLGMEGCDFVGEGETNEAVIEACHTHAGSEHGETMTNLSDEDKAKIEAKMKELLDAQD